MQFFINSLIQLSSIVFVSVLIIEKLTNISFFILMPIVVLISIFYALIGGIKAVIITDTIQMTVTSDDSNLLGIFNDNSCI